MRPVVLLVLWLIPMALNSAPGAEFNAFFPRRPVALSPLMQRIQGQAAQGCTSGVPGKRPLADRFDLRHQLPQPPSAALARAGAAISLANPDYQQARDWLAPLLADPDTGVAFAAYSVLLSHGARRLAAGDTGVTAGMRADLGPVGVLARAANANDADLLFWEALLAEREDSPRQALAAVERAIAADPIFYNAHLLRLQILLDLGRSEVPSAGACQGHAHAVLQAAMGLFDLDTCPRHAILLLNWVRARPGDLASDVFAQLVHGYVAVVLRNPVAFRGIVTELRDRQAIPCRAQVLAELEASQPPEAR